MYLSGETLDIMSCFIQQTTQIHGSSSRHQPPELIRSTHFGFIHVINSLSLRATLLDQEPCFTTWLLVRSFMSVARLHAFFGPTVEAMEASTAILTLLYLLVISFKEDDELR
ncbi:hypothetical protein Droror1_Dr00008446 [Drosera rotundifolia]